MNLGIQGHLVDLVLALQLDLGETAELRAHNPFWMLTHCSGEMVAQGCWVSGSGLGGCQLTARFGDMLE